MNEPLAIAVICGTAREGRQSEKAAQWIADFGRKQPQVEIMYVDPKEFHLPPDGAPEDGRDPKYSEIVGRADAFFIVTPEYNHGYPGSLKRLLDSEDEGYVHKPVVLAGVSNGAWGGTRACEALLPVLRTLGLAVSSRTVYFPRIQELFDDEGVMKPDFIEGYTKSAQGAYDDLIWLARALKTARG